MKTANNIPGSYPEYLVGEAYDDGVRAERERIRKAVEAKFEKIHAEFQKSFDDGRVVDEGWRVARHCEMQMLREVLTIIGE